MSKIKLGIIRETKNPPDKRVALTPQQCVEVLKQYPDIEIFVQPSELRGYKDEEYQKLGIELKEDLSACDILLGIKEVKILTLLDEKTYFFFSHTIKKQPYNRDLLRTILQKKIRLIDYETLTDIHGNRIIAFGRYAGIVGAYNGILTYGKKYNLFHLKPANECLDKNEMKSEYLKMKLPPIKIVVTGGGRVANGAIEVLDAMGIKRVNPEDIIKSTFDYPVYAQLRSKDYHFPKDGSEWDSDHFYAHPEKYDSFFMQYAKYTDILMACAFWDPKAPKLFTLTEIKKPEFKLRVIADITCDIDGSIPTTLKATTIADPVYDYKPDTDEIVAPYSNENNISVMSVDNLPCELPRDSSAYFGKQMIENVLPNLFGNDESGIISRATIAENGELTKNYRYLQNYVDGN
jgi:saccharopine dehydrogenase (NAD+, L-lysine forming)